MNSRMKWLVTFGFLGIVALGWVQATDSLTSLVAKKQGAAKAVGAPPGFRCSWPP